MADQTPDVTQQQLPPPNVAGLATLFPQQPGATATLGAQPPAQPQQPDIMQEMIDASRQGREAFGVESGHARDIGSQVQSLIQQQQQTQIPKTSWLDTQGQPQQSGFLHSLGRALMAIGGATVPGRAIQAQQYGPGIRRYEAETGARAKQIAELQGEEKEAGQRATAAGGLVSKPITAAGSAMRGEAAKSRADAYVQTELPAKVQTMLAGVDLKKAALDEKSRNDLAKQLQAKVDEEGRNYRSLHRDATAEEIAQVSNGTKEAIANEVSARNPSLKEWAMQWLGMGTPQLPATQPAQTVTPNAPPKKAPTAAKGKTTFTSGGRTYHIPAGMEKDFLKDHPDAKRQ